ncbi:MAG: hypothetical protein J6I49_02220 [Bacteroidales bacterium]|nr:hypothetical protein [Bacteroidales bacterium]
MHKTIPTLLAVALAASLAACADDPVADRVAGGYDCAITVATRYYKGDKLRDTLYVYPDNSGKVSISKVDDNTVKVSVESSRLRINKVFDTVHLTDWNYQANLTASKDTLSVNGYRCAADFSGSVTYDPRAIAVSLRVENYPGSNGKYIVSFANHSY